MASAHRIHVNLPHADHPHQHPPKEHIAQLPHPCFKMTTIKRYRMAKKPDVGEEKILFTRNFCVGIAAFLFLCSLIPNPMVNSHSMLYAMRGIAYIFGAGAYLSEMVMLTDGFKHMHPFREMFMIYVFGFLYILMAGSYLLEM